MSTPNSANSSELDAVIMEPGIDAIIHQINKDLTSSVEKHPDSPEMLRVKQNMVTLVDEVERKIKVNVEIMAEQQKEHEKIVGDLEKMMEIFFIQQSLSYVDYLSKIYEKFH